MASFVYDAAVNAAWQGELSLGTAEVKMLLVTDAYTPSQTADAFVSSVAGGARVATTEALTGKSFTAARFDADDPGVSALSGATVSAVVVFVDSGTDATSRLISYNVVTPAYVPTGADVVVSIPTTGVFGRS